MENFSIDICGQVSALPKWTFRSILISMLSVTSFTPYSSAIFVLRSWITNTKFQITGEITCEIIIPCYCHNNNNVYKRKKIKLMKLINVTKTLSYNGNAVSQVFCFSLWTRKKIFPTLTFSKVNVIWLGLASVIEGSETDCSQVTL